MTQTQNADIQQTAKTVQAAGAWLAVASFLIVLTLVFHGPLADDTGGQMTRIAEAANTWSVVHWIAALSLSLYAVAGLLVLTSRSRLVQRWWTLTAWAAIPVAALWTVTTAVAETTVVANAAVSGRAETFEAWWAFSEGKANGYAVMALAVAVVAANEARVADGVRPTWFAWAAVAAGVASFLGWALGVWFGIAVGNLVWLVASIVMSAWIFAFGVALMRSSTETG